MRDDDSKKKANIQIVHVVYEGYWQLFARTIGVLFDFLLVFLSLLRKIASFFRIGFWSNVEQIVHFSVQPKRSFFASANISTQ